MENKELNNEEVIKDNKLEENPIEEMLAIDEIHEDSKFMKFLKKLLSSVADQIITIGLSLVGIVLFDFILKLFGLYIAERQPMFLIIYVIVNILYSPICESTKLNKTIGKKVIKK